MRPYIAQERCIHCEECVSICPYDVFSKKDGNVTVDDPESCIECLACVDLCPEHAIYMDD